MTRFKFLTFKSAVMNALLISAQLMCVSAAHADDNAVPVTDADMAIIHVTLTGVQPADGPLFVGVQDDKSFMSDDYLDSGQYKITEAGQYNYTFEVPPGEYAVSAWHDINNDQKFNLSLMFRPKEGWAMSGKPVRGKPSFKKAKIIAPSGEMNITLPMSYPKNFLRNR